MNSTDDWTIAANYVPADRRAAFLALGALDARLGDIVRTTTQPLIGQMRLAWWHEQLCALDAGTVLQGEPLLAELSALRGHDVSGATLAGLVEGWEMLLEPLPLDAALLGAYGEKRGGGLFALAGRMIGKATSGGAGWALADFAMHCSDAVTRERAVALARDALPRGRIGGAKALRVLVSLARSDLAGPRSRWALLRAMLAG